MPRGKGSGPSRIVERQKAAADRLRREVLGRSLAHPYFRDLNRQLRNWHAPASLRDVHAACLSCRVVYLGEFHALQACQSFAAELLERLAKKRKPRLALGVELFFTRQQALLDQRQAGRIDDRTFLRRVHYREEWGYPWAGYRNLLDRARALAVPVYALDSSPRGGFDGLPRRDAHAARQIANLIGSGHRLLVLFGESHVSPGHIPRRVAQRLERAGHAHESVTVYQDPDPVYWSLLSRGVDLPRAVRVDDTTFAVFHTSPLEKYEAYRQVLERWREDVPHDEEVDLTPAVHHLIGALLQWLGIRSERRRVRHRAGWVEDLTDALPEVHSGPDATELLAPILEQHGRSREEVAEARMLLEHRGALYESRSNTMFLARYLPGRAAGEGARFLRAALTGRLYDPPEESWPDPAARAYGAAYNEALAHLGSRLVDPASDFLSGDEPAARAALGPFRGGPGLQSDEQIQWLSAHRRFEDSGHLAPPSSLLEPLRRFRSLRRALARDLGQRVGRVLVERVRRGELDARGLRHLFSRPLVAGRAQPVLLALLRRG